MRLPSLLVISLAACRGTVHTISGSSVANQARDEQELRDACAVLTGLRHETCMRKGPPRAPERDAWATASWWLYELHHREMVPGNVEAYGPLVVCTSYVAFEQDHVVESDELCHRVKSCEP